jgi:hypothetical protein
MPQPHQPCSLMPQPGQVGPLFSDADLDRALSALDLALQDYPWKPGENRLIIGFLFEALKARGVTRVLARALFHRLVEWNVFMPWSRTIPAGVHFEPGCPLPIYKSESETTHCLVTTYDCWYTFLAEYKNARAVSPSPAVSPPGVDVEDTPHADGPEPPYWFWWQAKRVRIGRGKSRRPWQLLDYMWGRSHATFQELCGPGKPWEDPVSDATFSTTANRVNNDLPVAYPRRLAVQNSCVIWKELPQNHAR